jgi:hypothetical protein
MPHPISTSPDPLTAVSNSTAMRQRARARQKVHEMRRKRDIEDVDTWLRIIVAIGTLGTPPTDAWH